MSAQFEDHVFQSIPFEQLQAGMKSEPVHQVICDDVQSYVALSGDNHPLYMDETHSRKTMFHEPVVHGMLSASY